LGGLVGRAVWDLIQRSQFNLFYDIGVSLFGNRSRGALEFAVNRIALTNPYHPTPVHLKASIVGDPQASLELEKAIERTKKSCRV